MSIDAQDRHDLDGVSSRKRAPILEESLGL